MLLLEANMEQYAYPAADLDEERAQHIASLRFHGILAEQADNPLLGFIVDFMVNLLSDLTVYRRLYSPPNIELWQRVPSSLVQFTRTIGCLVLRFKSLSVLKISNAPSTPKTPSYLPPVGWVSRWDPT